MFRTLPQLGPVGNFLLNYVQAFQPISSFGVMLMHLHVTVFSLTITPEN